MPSKTDKPPSTTARTEIMSSTHDALDAAIGQLQAEMWGLHRRLSGSYDNIRAQLRDAVRLGEMAARVLKLFEARDVVDQARMDANRAEKE